MGYDLIGADFVGAAGFVGGDEVDALLSGTDIIGASHHRQNAAHHRAALAQAHAIAAKKAHAGLAFEQQKPGASRRLVLGMASSSTIAASALSSITARPQNLAFKPQRIVIPATIAPDFLITDIKVGNVSQMVQSGTVPAEAFTQQLFDGMMEMDTVQTSQDFVLAVQNIAGAARSFNAAVYGLALLAR